MHRRWIASVSLLISGAAPALASPQGGPPQFRYVDELDLVASDARGRIKPRLVDSESGRVTRPDAKPTGTPVPAFIAVRTAAAGTELQQNHLRDVSILRPLQLNQKIRDDLGFAAGIDPSRQALVLSRLNYLQRHATLFEVSNVIGLVQGAEVYLGQLEMRFGRQGRALHVLRTLQRAGPLLANGFPCLGISELVQTATESGRDTAKMVRIFLVFPRTRTTRARIQVHMVGQLRRHVGGRGQARDLHCISEFTPGGDGVNVRVWTSAGENYPFMSWEEALAVKHEAEWRTTDGSGVTGSHKWERPYQPYAPAARGLRPIPAVMLLQLPSGWHKGSYGGAPLRGKRVPVKQGRWSLTDKDVLVPGGSWCFDKKGELVLRTPFGNKNAKKVRAFFKVAFQAARSDPAQTARLRDCLDVILAWSTDMPQRPGAGPRERPPSIAQLLESR